MILTGVPVTADEMERRGVVARVIPSDQDVLKEALGTAQTIVARSAPAVRLAKQVVKAGKSYPAPEYAELTEASRDDDVGHGAGDRTGFVLQQFFFS